MERAERKQREGVEKRMKNNEANEDKEQFPTFDYTPSIAVDSLTIHQLNSDILQLIFSYLSLKEKVAIESGEPISFILMAFSVIPFPQIDF